MNQEESQYYSLMAPSPNYPTETIMAECSQIPPSPPKRKHMVGQ